MTMLTDTTTNAAASTGAASTENLLVARLRAGDEQAFETLVRAHHNAMLAVASSYVRTREVAEEVVQETWLAVLRAIHGFEGRAALKTWIFRILVNTAKTRGGREARSLPFSSLESDDEREPPVGLERFQGPDDPYPGHWRAEPSDWSSRPHEVFRERETLAVVQRTIESLPEQQRRVITMRDIVGFEAGEVSNALALSANHQRVLLHRARSRVRSALEAHLDD